MKERWVKLLTNGSLNVFVRFRSYLLLSDVNDTFQETRDPKAFHGLLPLGGSEESGTFYTFLLHTIFINSLL